MRRLSVEILPIRDQEKKLANSTRGLENKVINTKLLFAVCTVAASALLLSLASGNHEGYRAFSKDGIAKDDVKTSKTQWERGENEEGRGTMQLH